MQNSLPPYLSAVGDVGGGDVLSGDLRAPQQRIAGVGHAGSIEVRDNSLTLDRVNGTPVAVGA